MNWLLYFHIIFPMLISVALLLLSVNSRIYKVITGVSGIVLLSTSTMLMFSVFNHGILSLQVGEWKAPFGITLVADHLSALMALIVNFLGLCTISYSLREIPGEERDAGYFPALFLLISSCNGITVAGDIFNLYVWIEVMVIASFVLLSMGKKRSQIKGTIPYVVLNFMASMFILASVGLLLGSYGTLNLADLAQSVRIQPDRPLVTGVAFLLLSGIGIKSALFPLFFWLPESYHTPRVAISAFFAGAFTKIGIYIFFRLFTLLFIGQSEWLNPLLLWISIFTMATGVLGAVAQYEFRRLLSFHIVSQVGYMIFGLALFSKAAVAGAIFFIIHNILAKSNLFFISGLAQRSQGTFHLKQMGGLYSLSPTLSFLFLISALSLAGLPPLSGFWGKLALVRAGLQSAEYLGTAVALTVGLLTTYSMLKIWREAFWKKAKTQPTNQGAQPIFLVTPVWAIAIAIIYIGFLPHALMEISERAADELLNPEVYIKAILKEGGAK